MSLHSPHIFTVFCIFRSCFVSGHIMRLNQITRFNYHQIRLKYNSDILTCSQLSRLFSSKSSDNDEGEITKIETQNEKKDKMSKAKAKLNDLLTNVKTHGLGTSSETISDTLAKPKTKKRTTTVPLIAKSPEQIEQRLLKAAKMVAQKLEDKDESQKMQSTLFKMVQLQNEERKPHKPQVIKNIENMIKVMDKEKPLKGQISNIYDDSVKMSISQQTGIREKPPKILSKKEDYTMTACPSQAVNYYNSQPLNVFSIECLKQKPESSMKTWERLSQEELNFLTLHPPTNTFEEMILWTKQGKMWSFPINNEAGLDEEAKVPFYEHVLLDHMLDDFYPTGPVRDFMELVMLGLTNNPYINVERKKAYIEWYLDYFKEKESILKAAGAI